MYGSCELLPLSMPSDVFEYCVGVDKIVLSGGERRRKITRICAMYLDAWRRAWIRRLKIDHADVGGMNWCPTPGLRTPAKVDYRHILDIWE
jgi:hypothetical protein